MKYATYLAGVLLLFSSFLFSNCTADRGEVSTPGEIVAQGSWNVKALSAGSDQTALYNGFAFTFGPRGVLTISNNGEVSTGSWRWIRNVKTEVLELHLPNAMGLQVLNDQWTLEQWGLYSLTLKKGTSVLTLQQSPMP